MRDSSFIIAMGLSITLAGALVTPAVGYEPATYQPGVVNADIQAWKLPPAEAEAATVDHRLVGLGCGPNRITGTAREEDEFPYPCYAIGVPADMCPDDEGDYPTVAECAAYLGEGW